MNSKVENLISSASAIVGKTDFRPGIGYPDELKQIVRTLVVEHGLTINKVSTLISISRAAVNNWAYPDKEKQGKVSRRKKPVKFKRISIVEEPRTKSRSETSALKAYLLAILVLQFLLLGAILFPR